MNLVLFLAIVYIVILVVGYLFEKIKVPWIFSALFIGLIISIHNPFKEFTSSAEFNFLASLGMYFLLFIIGFELNVREMLKRSSFIIRSTFFIITLEGLIGSLVVHYVFHYPWFISLLVAFSFATVGEAVLIPILDEFKVINTKLGQAIIGIGILDDIFEIIIIAIVSILIGLKVGHTQINITSMIVILIGLFLLTILLTKLKNKASILKIPGDVSALFLFSLFLLFLFIGLALKVELAPIAAILAGIALGNFIPEKRLNVIKDVIKTISYGLFAPMFFLSVGLSVEFSYLTKYPLLVLLVVAVSKSVKILGSYIMGRKELGVKQSLLLGIGLSVRFSTSIVIIKLLFDAGIIGFDIYSVIVASTIIFKFIIPLLFSRLLIRWGVVKHY